MTSCCQHLGIRDLGRPASGDDATLRHRRSAAAAVTKPSHVTPHLLIPRRIHARIKLLSEPWHEPKRGPGSVERLGPAAGGVDDGQDVDLRGRHAIGDDVGGAGDDQLAGAGDSARAAHVGVIA